MILTQEGKEIVAIYKQNGDEVDEVKDANGRLVYTNTREITGTLPLSFTSRGKPLADYRISGNTLQDGTPAPDAPVDVVGCGVRTGNLFDEDYTGISATPIYKPIYVGNENVTLSIDCPLYQSAGVLFILAGNVSSGISTNINAVWLGNPKTVTPIDGYVTIAFRGYGPTSPVGYHAMLNLGSTALPYEPYGYKLPLTVNGTEYPIYLGQVETTRLVKKLVLTGKEGTIYSNPAIRTSNAFYITRNNYLDNTLYGFCTHYPTVSQTSVIEGVRYGKNINIFTKLSDGLDTVEKLKSYLAAQYAAGTPVTIWYVLAEQETGIINEPLMKIGNYADTITMAQAGVTIPTVSGTNVLDTTTPVKPSEVYIKGKGIKSIT